MENISSNTPNFHLTVKNYRCFPDNKPVHISVRNGFTAFVGVNNSGKSSLLKLFYELRGLFSILHQNGGNFVSALKQPEKVAFTPPSSVPDIAQLFCKINPRDIVLEFEVHNDLDRKQRTGILPERITLTIIRDTNTFSAEIFVNGKILPVKNDTPIGIPDSSHIDIRGTVLDMEDYCRVFKALSSTVYIGAFRNAINIGGNVSYYDMTIGEQFIKLWDSLKSGGGSKQTDAALELTDDIRKIFGYSNLEINATSDNNTLQVIVNGKSYRLEELGSGLAQFVVVLANIAAKQPSWVLIDEPELNLHPSLQIDFLTTLASYATEGIMFATHNIGLARASADCIYSFRTDEKGQNEVRDFETIPRLSEFLGELSYAGYKDIGFQKVLLVEGSTEVRTIQQFLRKYNKDHKIVLLSLGGSDLINSSSSFELEEVKRITDGHISALIDSELKSSDDTLCADRQAFVNNCKEANIDCHVLELRAIENYFSNTAIRAIKGEKYQALAPYQKLKEASLSWSKQENWRIAREMNSEELNNTDLGKFLQSL